MTRPLDASLAVYEADSATILLVFYQHEADYATVLPHFLEYEADSAANLPLLLSYEADRAAILLPILEYDAELSLPICSERKSKSWDANSSLRSTVGPNLHKASTCFRSVKDSVG